MKILFVTDLCPIVEHEAGLPETLLDFAAGFQKDGEQVKVFRPNLIFNVLVRKRKLYRSGKYSNRDVEICSKNFLFFDRASVLRAYRKFFRDEKFDVVVAHMPSGLLCGNIIAKEFDIPLLSSVHASDIRVLKNFKYRFFRRGMIDAYKNSACVLPRSFWLKEKIRKTIPDLNKPLEIVYSGLPLKIVEENYENLRKFNPKKAKILTVSSLIKRKNLKNLLRAYKKLQKIYPKITFQIAGDGPLRGKIEKYIEKYNLNVKLLGQISKEEVYKKMQEADIFILPSKNETFGMVYMEAMTFGMATICAMQSGVDGIIEDGKNGILTSYSSRGIFGALNRVLNLSEKEFLLLSQNARQTAKMFCYENSVQNYLDKIKIFRI